MSFDQDFLFTLIGLVFILLVSGRVPYGSYSIAHGALPIVARMCGSTFLD